ncbi:urease accessory protein UreD [Trichodelitschia bisporula]|uniref:Urease accessory protein UreD n=1 Tax=Trichodelitschia bisporula TaxID=703511 RepID=A0A6G1HSJ8_9PEZI|nr:urease accessory protein UreD [Trichodelitschia bisporula]
MASPFASSTSLPGLGTIHVALLPPTTPVLQTLSYQYPLKLIAPDPSTLRTDAGAHLVHTVFLLTYGGGLVAGDTIDLRIKLSHPSRLVLLTQGSTKIFKTPTRSLVSGQRLVVDFEPGAALCYLPDPVQPYADSVFEQTQVYNVPGPDSSLCVCDWVSEGRTARGEKWSFYKYTSKNEVWLVPEEGDRKLILRDNVLLDDSGNVAPIAGRIDNLGVFGTLILVGPLFKALGEYFVDEFKRLPRIGNRNWDDTKEVMTDSIEVARARRQKQETKDGLLWTAAHVRGLVLVKFGAREVEGVKQWLSTMIKAEGSIETNFGERALLCLK